MANKTEHNVADDHNAAEDNYKRTFATSKQLEDMENDAIENPDETPPSGQPASAKDVKKLEKNPTDASVKKSKGSDEELERRFSGRTVGGVLKHGSAYAFLFGLVGVGLAFSSFFAPNIIMINIKEMYTNDLADATIALWEYDKKLLDYKLKNACSDETIKCKLSQMSRNQVKRLEKAGFTVNGQKVKEDKRDDKDPANDDKGESRFKVSSIGFPKNGGSASSADQYEKMPTKAML